MRLYSEVTCKHCQKTFKPISSNNKFCSSICNINFNIIEDSNGCMNWTKSKNKGYGQIRKNGEVFLTHRIMCEHVHGPAPEGKNCVMHSCDNPSCNNPDHLSWGSYQDNIIDKIKKNRHKTGNSNSSVLCEDDVRIILKRLKDGNKIKAIAKDYNVSVTAIIAIKNKVTWKFVV